MCKATEGRCRNCQKQKQHKVFPIGVDTKVQVCCNHEIATHSDDGEIINDFANMITTEQRKTLCKSDAETHYFTNCCEKAEEIVAVLNRQMRKSVKCIFLFVEDLADISATIKEYVKMGWVQIITFDLELGLV